MAGDSCVAVLLKLEILFNTLCIGATTLILCQIVYLFCTRGKKRMCDIFQIFAILSICCSYCLQLFVWCFGNNFVIPWHYQQNHSALVPTVNIFSIIMFVITKMLFYVACQLHIEQYFAKYILLNQRMHEILKIALVLSSILFVIACIILVTIVKKDEHHLVVSEVNQWLSMVNVCSVESVWRTIAYFLIILAFAMNFLAMTRIYRSIYKKQELMVDEITKYNASKADDFVFASTILSISSMLLLMTPWNGRWILFWILLCVDCVCMFYLMANANSAAFVNANNSENVIQFTPLHNNDSATDTETVSVDDNRNSIVEEDAPFNG